MWKTRCVEEIDRGTAASTATPRVVMCTVRQAFSVFDPGGSTIGAWTCRCSTAQASPGRAPVSAMNTTSGPHWPHSSATRSTSSHDSNGSIRSDRRCIGARSATAGFA